MQIRCSVCDKLLATAGSLRRHMRLMHAALRCTTPDGSHGTPATSTASGGGSPGTPSPELLTAEYIPLRFVLER